MSADFVALLFGVIGVLATGVAVFALYISATNAEQKIAREIVRAEKLAKETEELRAKNLAFEVAISPRTLEQNLTAKKLEPFSDIYFRVVSPSDFEPKRTAGQIRFMLRQANWQKLSRSVTPVTAFHDGVFVHVGPFIHGHDSASRQGFERSQEAAKALVDVLNQAGIDAVDSFPIPELGPREVLVVVGPKPLPRTLQLQPENIPADVRGIREWGNIDEE